MCSNEECGNPSSSRGLCRSHYGKAYRSNTLPPRAGLKHFLSNIDREAQIGDCEVCGAIKLTPKYAATSDSSYLVCPVGRKAGREGWLNKHRPNRKVAGAPRRHSQVPYSSARDARLQQKYGISEREYDAMAEEQGGACAICRLAPEARLVVDHDHTTGMVRSLLCHACNVALGFLRDNPENALGARDYLVRWSAVK